MNGDAASSWPKLLKVTLICAAALAIGIAGGLVGHLGDRQAAKDRALFQQGIGVQPSGTPLRAKITVTNSGIGVFVIPTQIPAGTYLMTSNDSDFGCQWWLLKNLSGDDKARIGDHPGQVYRAAGVKTMTVTGREAGVQMVGNSCIWQLIG